MIMSLLNVKLRHGTDTFLSTLLFKIFKHVYSLAVIYWTEYKAHIHTPLMSKVRYAVLSATSYIVCHVSVYHGDFLS